MKANTTKTPQVLHGRVCIFGSSSICCTLELEKRVKFWKCFCKVFVEYERDLPTIPNRLCCPPQIVAMAIPTKHTKPHATNISLYPLQTSENLSPHTPCKPLVPQGCQGVSKKISGMGVYKGNIELKWVK